MNKKRTKCDLKHNAEMYLSVLISCFMKRKNKQRLLASEWFGLSWERSGSVVLHDLPPPGNTDKPFISSK